MRIENAWSLQTQYEEDGKEKIMRRNCCQSCLVEIYQAAKFNLIL